MRPARLRLRQGSRRPGGRNARASARPQPRSARALRRRASSRSWNALDSGCGLSSAVASAEKAIEEADRKLRRLPIRYQHAPDLTLSTKQGATQKPCRSRAFIPQGRQDSNLQPPVLEKGGLACCGLPVFPSLLQITNFGDGERRSDCLRFALFLTACYQSATKGVQNAQAPRGTSRVRPPAGDSLQGPL